MHLSVIISTYNSPDWLEKVLWGYAAQTYRDFELVVADDGSQEETRGRIETLTRETSLPIRHVWHPDDGFQKSAILNKAIVAARHDYLVFSDGDCIPRNDFLGVHATRAEKGRFLSGGYCKLDLDASRSIERKQIDNGEAFEPDWLAKHGLAARVFSKHSAAGWWAPLYNFLTPTNPSWNGHNASGWKDDLLRVNGFDERMQYGGQDRELGERLQNSGIRGKQIRYLAICLHLDHGRGYATEESIKRNRRIRDSTQRERRTWTDCGIEQNEEMGAGKSSRPPFGA